jgi:hypothetical protein
LISLHKIKKEINILEKNLLKQIEIKKQKHNYKEIWLGFDRANDNKSYVTTMSNKQNEIAAIEHLWFQSEITDEEYGMRYDQITARIRELEG